MSSEDRGLERIHVKQTMLRRWLCKPQGWTHFAEISGMVTLNLREKALMITGILNYN